MTHEDDEFIKLLLLEDRKAWRQVDEWARSIVRRRAWGTSADEAQDLIQEIRVSLWKQIAEPGFVVRKSLRALVNQIATCRCIDWIRKKTARVFEPADSDMPDTSPDALDWLVAIEKTQRERAGLRLILTQLNERCKELFRLHFHDQLTYPQIAERWALKPATVGVHMFNCLNRARKLKSRLATAAAA